MTTETGPLDAVVVRTPARRIDVTGEDRVRYLDDVTSQALADVPIGHVRGTLYLDPHGAPLAMFDVVVLGDRLALVAPDDEVAGSIVEVLGGRTFLLDARFELLDDPVVAVRGDDAAGVVASAGLAAVEGRSRVAGDLLVVSRGAGAVDLAGPSGALDEAITALTDAGAREGTSEDLIRWRVRSGVPAWGSEVVAPHLPEEAGLLPTHVHLAKGCYPGQEAVARMWMLGRPRRRLAVVRAEPGVLAEGAELGEGRQKVTISTVDPDGREALAYVPSDTEPGTTLAADGVDLEVVSLVGASASPPGHDPSVTRRRDRPRTA